MFYNGTSVEADKVIYDQKTSAFMPRQHPPDRRRRQKSLTPTFMDLSGRLPYGFVDSLRGRYRRRNPHGGDAGGRTGGN